MNYFFERKKKAMRKLKEREPELNRYLTGRMEVTYTEKICNSEKLEGLILKSGKGNVQPILYSEESWNKMTDEELAEHLYQLRMEVSVPEIPKQIFEREKVLSRVLPMVMEGDRVSELESQGILAEPKDGFTILYYLPIPEFSQEEEVAIARLSNKVLSSYDLSLDEIRKVAFEHLEKDIRIETVSEDVRKIYSENSGYGSSAILSEPIRMQLQELYGDRCCLIPCSMDFTIIFPETMLERPEMLAAFATGCYLSIRDVRDRFCKTPYLLENGELKAI